MENNNRICLYPFIILGIALMFIGSCKKDSNPVVQVPVLETSLVSGIAGTTATCGGVISSDAGLTITARGVCWGTGTTPTTAGSKTTDGDGAGTFTSSITGLIPNTTYYVRAYATNGNGTGYGSEMCFTTISTVTDIDGNEYITVTIGTQVWMAENLKTTKYANGTSIPMVTDAANWAVLTSTDKAFCYPYNYNTYADIYGNFYTWAAAMNGASSSNANPSGVQGVCPTGWHLPGDAEWTQLVDFLGGDTMVVGGKLKETGMTHWADPNTGADNSSGFTALPGGARNPDGTFGAASLAAYFWTATSSGVSHAWTRLLGYNDSQIWRVPDAPMTMGLSVRCIKDN